MCQKCALKKSVSVNVSWEDPELLAEVTARLDGLERELVEHLAAQQKLELELARMKQKEAYFHCMIESSRGFLARMQDPHKK